MSKVFFSWYCDKYLNNQYTFVADTEYYLSLITRPLLIIRCPCYQCMYLLISRYHLSYCYEYSRLSLATQVWLWLSFRAASHWQHRCTLQWRHNDYCSVSNHQPHGCLLNRLFRSRSKKTSKLRVTGLCAGKSPGPVNSPHKGPVTRKMFSFDDVIM